MTNLISWVGIPAIQFERAVMFYEHVLNIVLKPKEFADEKMACVPHGEVAIIKCDGFVPALQGSMVNFAVNRDLTSVLQAVVEAGIKVL